MAPFGESEEDQLLRIFGLLICHFMTQLLYFFYLLNLWPTKPLKGDLSLQITLSHFKESVPPLVLETINDPRLSAERLLVPEVAAVLVGFDGSFQYWNLLLAASYLADKEVGGLLQMQSYLLWPSRCSLWQQTQMKTFSGRVWSFQVLTDLWCWCELCTSCYKKPKANGRS